MTVYRDTRYPALRLVTCGGPFDAPTGQYLDNIIVYAHLVLAQRGWPGRYRRATAGDTGATRQARASLAGTAWQIA